MVNFSGTVLELGPWPKHTYTERGQGLATNNLESWNTKADPRLSGALLSLTPLRQASALRFSFWQLLSVTPTEGSYLLS